MELPSDLIAQFAKAVTPKTETKKETTVYGTTVEHEGTIYVKMDGSELLTPVSTTTDMQPGERVTVMIKNHSATVTGNISSPSARTDDVKTVANNTSDVSNKISEFEIAIGDRMVAAEGEIDNLLADTVTIKQHLAATDADIETLQADNVIIKDRLTATEADITKLQTDKLDAELAEITYATIKDLDATNAEIHNLEATYGDFAEVTTGKIEAIEADIIKLETGGITTEVLDARYANIDFSNIGKAAMEHFYSQSGLIENVVVGEQTITGNLVGVTISGDLIEGNTVKADKLVIKGTDGLYYKLNTEGITTEAEQTDQNSLNGQIIKAKSITASKIAVTDLVAFDATIGGFNITENSIYSGAKESVDNTTRGIYLDNDGQMAFGDSNSFIKYYKDTDGVYKLAIAANDIALGSSHQSVGGAIAEVDAKVDNLTIGGRNLLKGTNFDGESIHYERMTSMSTEGGFHFYPTEQIESGVEYVLSLSIRGYANIVFYEINSVGGNCAHYWITRDELSEEEFRDFQLLFTVDTNRVFTNAYICTRYGEDATKVGDWFEIKSGSVKLERGNRKTDWSPAPEDMATNGDTEAVQKAVDLVEDRLFDAESIIQKLLESIMMLVTDGDGSSLMVQTENGWTYNMAALHDVVNSTSEKLDVLTNEMNDIESVLDILKRAMQEFDVIGEYVKITTYEDEPCIELGERDSDFKLLITNTRILFMEGSGTPAYVTNQSLHIEKAVIEEELQQGEFVWKVRSNGNLGLMWKG